MDESDYRFDLLADGLAKAVLLIGDFPNDGNTIADILESYNSTLGLHDLKLKGLGQNLESTAQASAADNHNQFLMIIGVGILALIGVITSLALAIKLRKMSK